MTLVLPEADRRRRLVKRILFIGLPVLLIAGGAYYYFAGQPQADAAGKGKGAGRLQPVSVADVKVADVPIWITALGTAVPRNLVTVHTRVDGELMKLHFREGQMVKQGEVLAEIDPRPFEVQLMQANGQLARDTALLQNARVDLERYKDLWAKDSIAKQQLDTQDALVRQYEGTVENDRGTVESAKLQLTYARVTAPAGGRIGLRQVDPGNQVHASDANGLVVIAQLQPMTVVFSMPETYLPAINRRVAASEPIVVEAWDREQKNRLAAGRLLTTDNLVDTTTGTIKMKAEFANSDNILFPNQFANVRLLLGVREKATVVPGAAILRGSKGPFVYTVDGEGTVTAVPITPGPEDAGLVAVEGPLKSGDRVVADGADKLRDGAKVEVITAEARAKPADGAKKPGTGGKRPGGGAPGGRPPRAEGAPAPAAN
jgi:multidrug efflux system membrane fusion protein